MITFIIRLFPFISSLFGKSNTRGGRNNPNTDNSDNKSTTIVLFILLAVIYIQYLHGNFVEGKFETKLEFLTSELSKAEEYIKLQNMAIETNENYYNDLETRVNRAKKEFEKTIREQEEELKYFRNNSLAADVNCGNIEQILIDGIEDLQW